MKKEYTGVDIFKICAAFGVIAIHTDMPFLKVVGRLSVPFFAIISSFFFFKHFFSLDNDIEKKKYLFKFEKRMGLLILGWQIIYLPLAIEYFKRLVINQHNSIIKYLYYFVYPGYTNANGWGQSWYLIAMLIGIPVFLFLIKYCHLYGMFLISGMLEIYYIAANEFGFLTKLPVWGTLYFPRLIVYILIGYLFAKNSAKLTNFKEKNILISLLIMFFIFIIENYLIKLCGGLSNSEEVISTVPTSIILVLFSLKYSPKLKMNALMIRNSSTFIYCAQNYPLQLFIKKCSRFLMSSVIAEVVFFFFVSLTCIILFIVYSGLAKRYRVFRYLV